MRGQHTDTAKATQRKVLRCGKWDTGAFACASTHSWKQQQDQGGKLRFFSRLCQTKRDFRKDNTWEIKVSQPTPISYHEALVDLPKVVHFSRKLLYLSLGHVTQDAVSLFCLPILFPPFTSLLPPPADPVGSLSANPKTFQSLCHPGATRPPLAVSHHRVASKPYLLLPCIIKL